MKAPSFLLCLVLPCFTGFAANSVGAVGAGAEGEAHGFVLDASMQDLTGRATAEGLWVRSTGDDTRDEFRIRAMVVGAGDSPAACGKGIELEPVGAVMRVQDSVMWIRPGLTEVYTTSMDGIRQDFLVQEEPPGFEGTLEVVLAVEGARARAQEKGATLVMDDGAGRELAYHRLFVTDANGRELPSRIEVDDPYRLRIIVDVGTGRFPIQIDPTISDDDWSGFTGLLGVKGALSAMTVDANGDLYIGGEFVIAGDTLARSVVRWDGSDWNPLGAGISGFVTSLVSSGTTIYAGGYFSAAGEVEANAVAKWDGQEWSSVGDGLDGGVNVLLLEDGMLYAGGTFTKEGNDAIKNLATWDGNSWSPLGSDLDGSVDALVFHEGDLHIGGRFTSVSGVPASKVARWDGSSWFNLGGGLVDRGVWALEVFDGELVAGGDFRADRGAPADAVARWDGSSWLPLDISFSNRAARTFTLEAVGDELFIGGVLYNNSDGFDNLVIWDGETWRPSQEGITYEVHDIVSSGDKVYLAGRYDIAFGGVNARSMPVYQRDASGWSILGEGINNEIRAVAVSGSDIYIGGAFTRVGSIEANRIAKWDGREWSALGSGLDKVVNVLLLDGDGLVAGGEFTRAGGVEALRIARWDGEQWSAIGEGFERTFSDVQALARSGDRLFAAGNLSDFNHVAEWDGRNWSQVGEGMISPASDLEIKGGQLYIGGGDTVGEHRGVARWTGNSWIPVGEAFSSVVAEIAFTDDALFAIGSFSEVGGDPADRIARWDGTSWSGLSESPNTFVTALATHGNDIYISGWFTEIGETEARGIARWDGAGWSALGSGLNSFANQIIVAEPYLYVGGVFTSAGGQLAPYLARAVLSTPPVQTDSVGLVGNELTIIFTADAGITGWTILGGSEPGQIDTDLSESLSITETSPGRYEALVDISSIPGSATFLQIGH